MPGDDLIALPARRVVELVRARELTPVELVEASLARIAAVDGRLNALPTVCAERALERAAQVPADAPLAGLPLAVKDLTDVAGVRTTYGSPIYADHVPDRSDLLVERLESQGAVVVAKSNTPEFGAGGNTFNGVFGETRNPWDTARTCGGSSGGAAAALASGQVWLATGSDLGGSLRTPAGFCGVVGLRPSPGRVAGGPSELPFGTLSVEGPMGRTVADAALMLDAMCGPHAADPLALEPPPVPYRRAAAQPRLPARVAFSPDLGITPVEPAVREACERAVAALDEAGVEVQRRHPDLSDAPEAFQVLRAAGFVADLEPLYATDRARLKPDVVWNIEQGLALTPQRVAWAERARGAVAAEMAALFGEVELLLCPTACVVPFDVAQRWVCEVDGVAFGNYVEWLRITSAITLSACPVVALPCALSGGGLPVGMQLVAPPRGEWGLIAAAAAIEQLLGMHERVPLDPRPAVAG